MPEDLPTPSKSAKKWTRKTNELKSNDKKKNIKIK